MRVCVKSGKSKSLNLVVTQAYSWRVNVFEYVWLFLPCASSGAACTSSPFLLNKKIPGSYTLWVDRNKIFQVYAGRFYFGSTKVQMLGRMSKHNLWRNLTYGNRSNYLFFEAPMFWFYEKFLICFFDSVCWLTLKYSKWGLDPFFLDYPDLRFLS